MSGSREIILEKAKYVGVWSIPPVQTIPKGKKKKEDILN